VAIKDINKIDFESIGLIPKAEKHPQFTVIYGKGGLGKTTAACYSPDPVIIPIGRETGHERMVANCIPAFQCPPDMAPLDFVFGAIQKLLKSEHSRKTVIFDNIGTFRECVTEDVESDHKGADLKAWGRGVSLEFPYYGKLLAGFDQLLKKGLHIILIAHDASYNINLESGDYFSRISIACPSGENTNVRGLLEARAHNVFFIQGENPTTVVKGAGGKNKQIATSGQISRVIYTKPAQEH